MDSQHGKRVAVALSGGVDSAVTAALLLDQGYDVLGLGMRLPEPWAALRPPAAAAASPAMEDAQRVAAALAIPFDVIDLAAEFEAEIIAPFCAAYACGETPNPCVWCNQRFKFGRLLREAEARGADLLATGHYARRWNLDNGWPALGKAADRRQDQSYFLYALQPEQLAKALFPLAGLTKAEVRAIAAARGLPVSEKPGSQDICFVGAEGYAALLAERCPQALVPGDILDRHGRVIGCHRGIGRYTLGQREGLGIAAPAPLYVVAIDAERNALVVAPKSEACITELMVRGVHWLLHDIPAAPLRCGIKPRYRSQELPAEVHPLPGGRARVVFETLQPPAAPGQSAVFYGGDRVLGGGIIHSPMRA